LKTSKASSFLINKHEMNIKTQTKVFQQKYLQITVYFWSLFTLNHDVLTVILVYWDTRILWFDKEIICKNLFTFI